MQEAARTDLCGGRQVTRVPTATSDRKQQWVIPFDANAAFVATMEDVLEVYQRPHDPQRPLVCLDETSKQLITETRAPILAKPGQPARHDYEYERNGVANLFMVFAPLEGWRHVKVTDRHTAIDYAHVLRDLSDTHFPNAAKIVLVQDNLNTQKPASLYEAFPAPEARRLAERLKWPYTPKHGSWLDTVRVARANGGHAVARKKSATSSPVIPGGKVPLRKWSKRLLAVGFEEGADRGIGL